MSKLYYWFYEAADAVIDITLAMWSSPWRTRIDPVIDTALGLAIVGAILYGWLLGASL